MILLIRTRTLTFSAVQIVFAVLGCWGVGIYSAMKIFGGGKKEGMPSAAPEQLDKH